MKTDLDKSVRIWEKAFEEHEPTHSKFFPLCSLGTTIFERNLTSTAWAHSNRSRRQFKGGNRTELESVWMELAAVMMFGGRRVIGTYLGTFLAMTSRWKDHHLGSLANLEPWRRRHPLYDPHATYTPMRGKHIDLFNIECRVDCAF